MAAIAHLLQGKREVYIPQMRTKIFSPWWGGSTFTMDRGETHGSGVVGHGFRSTDDKEYLEMLSITESMQQYSWVKPDNVGRRMWRYDMAQDSGRSEDL